MLYLLKQSGKLYWQNPKTFKQLKKKKKTPKPYASANQVSGLNNCKFSFNCFRLKPRQHIRISHARNWTHTISGNTTPF